MKIYHFKNQKQVFVRIECGNKCRVLFWKALDPESDKRVPVQKMHEVSHWSTKLWTLYNFKSGLLLQTHVQLMQKRSRGKFFSFSIAVNDQTGFMVSIQIRLFWAV